MKSEQEREISGVLKVVVDEELREDIQRARRATGIRSLSELVRYCLRRVANGERSAALVPGLSPWDLHAAVVRTPWRV